jgi:hypothetical protein
VPAAALGSAQKQVLNLRRKANMIEVALRERILEGD